MIVRDVLTNLPERGFFGSGGLGVLLHDSMRIVESLDGPHRSRSVWVMDRRATGCWSVTLDSSCTVSTLSRRDSKRRRISHMGRKNAYA